MIQFLVSKPHTDQLPLSAPLAGLSAVPPSTTGTVAWSAAAPPCCFVATGSFLFPAALSPAQIRLPPNKPLDPIPPAAAEQKQRIAERIQMELPLYQCSQTVDPLPQICVPTGDIYFFCPTKIIQHSTLPGRSSLPLVTPLPHKSQLLFFVPLLLLLLPAVSQPEQSVETL